MRRHINESMQIVSRNFSFCFLGLLIFCFAGSPRETTKRCEIGKSYPALSHLMQVSKRIFSGGEPRNREAFENLQSLGIKTVVNVDGAKPNVKLARQFGLRYVHIPIGYDSLPPKAGAALARLVWEAEGPFYIHCHHGKHRGPVAAAVACIADGDADAKTALKILERAGTSRNYAGLWRDVAAFKPPNRDSKLPQLVETADVDSMATAMATIDRSYDRLKLCLQSPGFVPKDHPDISASREALLIKEGFRETIRSLTNKKNQRLKEQLLEAEKIAKSLEKTLRLKDRPQTADYARRLAKSCSHCHVKHRN